MIQHYITFPEQKTTTLNSFTDWMLMNTELKETIIHEQNTVYWNESEESLNKKYENYHIDKLEEEIDKLHNIINLLDLEDRKYHTFKIPKHSGGFREINAPEGLLKTTQTMLNNLLNKILVHKAAHAYIPHHSIKTALEVHQENKSNYFLKLDIKDFFPNANKEFVYNTLIKIFPLSLIKDKEKFKSVLDIAFLNNSLPQGSPCSPTISNLIMIPIDYAITKMLQNLDKNYAYTRYADDILISSPEAFDFINIQNKVNYLLKEMTPFRIKQAKTRYGSNKGSNWNLGLMLNKDYNITIGHKTKERFRAKTWDILTKYKENTLTKELVYEYTGIYSYYEMVEKEYPFKIFKKECTKLDLDATSLLKILRKNNF